MSCRRLFARCFNDWTPKVCVYCWLTEVKLCPWLLLVNEERRRLFYRASKSAGLSWLSPMAGPHLVLSLSLGDEAARMSMSVLVLCSQPAPIQVVLWSCESRCQIEEIVRPSQPEHTEYGRNSARAQRCSLFTRASIVDSVCIWCCRDLELGELGESKPGCL